MMGAPCSVLYLCHTCARFKMNINQNWVNLWKMIYLMLNPPPWAQHRKQTNLNWINSFRISSKPFTSQASVPLYLFSSQPLSVYNINFATMIKTSIFVHYYTMNTEHWTLNTWKHVLSQLTFRKQNFRK